VAVVLDAERSEQLAATTANTTNSTAGPDTRDNVISTVS
jgi:hypothetical protein